MEKQLQAVAVKSVEKKPSTKAEYRKFLVENGHVSLSEAKKLCMAQLRALSDFADLADGQRATLRDDHVGALEIRREDFRGRERYFLALKSGSLVAPRVDFGGNPMQEYRIFANSGRFTWSYVCFSKRAAQKAILDIFRFGTLKRRALVSGLVPTNLNNPLRASKRLPAA
jgi:hypothetical protein